MLRTFDAVKVEHVLEYVDKKAQSQLTGQASKGVSIKLLALH